MLSTPIPNIQKEAAPPHASGDCEHSQWLHLQGLPCPIPGDCSGSQGTQTSGHQCSYSLHSPAHGRPRQRQLPSISRGAQVHDGSHWVSLGMTLLPLGSPGSWGWPGPWKLNGRIILVSMLGLSRMQVEFRLYRRCLGGLS